MLNIGLIEVSLNKKLWYVALCGSTVGDSLPANYDNSRRCAMVLSPRRHHHLSRGEVVVNKLGINSTCDATHGLKVGWS